VDEHGQVLDILLLEGRHQDAAKRFFEKLLEDHRFVSGKIITDQLGSYKAAWKQIPALEHVKHVFVKSEARLNNRIERDHEHVHEKQRSARGGCSLSDSLEVQLRCRDFTRNVFKRKQGTPGEARGSCQQAFQVWAEVLSSITLS
jgi:transposase-like protein